MAKSNPISLSLTYWVIAQKTIVAGPLGGSVNKKVGGDVSFLRAVCSTSFTERNHTTLSIRFLHVPTQASHFKLKRR
jgi:hypothetical protein